MPRARIAILLPLLLAPAAAADGLRIATWNISLYAGGREDAFHTAVYAEFEGRSLAPDAILVQEMTSAGALAQLVAILNSAPDSPGDWGAAPFIDGPDSDNALLYRASKLVLLDAVVVARGGPAPNHPRDVNRYDLRLIGYESAEALLSLYCSHMKAGSGGDDQSRRLLEAQRIRDDAAALEPPRHFLLGGDLNTQSSAQAAYEELTGPQADDRGRFLDPIATPGEWNNGYAFRFVHTQDPAGAGGMDDRHDQLLIAPTLADGDGLDYIGDPSLPYSVTTWNDPNHAYRAWGNDGASFNGVLRSQGNEMVGPGIADALKLVAAGGGHLPVFLDLRVPALAAADPVLDFGTVSVGEEVRLTLHAGNAGDTSLWGPGGVTPLRYTLAAPAPFAADPGPFADEAGGPLNEHEVHVDTSAPGLYHATLLLASNDPDTPVLGVALRAEVVAACPADWDGDGTLNTRDVLAFLNDWTARDPRADVNGDGVINTLDVLEFLGGWATGC